MKKQRFVSLLLVAALMIPLCTTAFAAGATTTDTEVTTDGATIQIPSNLNLPTIKVTIGAPPEICVNPYKMPYEHPKLTGPANDSVISVPAWIKSNSTLKMKIIAAPSVTTTGGNVEIMDKDIDDGIVTGPKQLSLVMYMDTVTGVGPTGKTAAESYTGGSNKIFVKGDGSNTVEITMDAADDETDAKATYGAFLINGKSRGGDWNKTQDTPTITIVFNIVPVITP